MKGYLCKSPGDPIHLGDSGIAKMVNIIKGRIHPTSVTSNKSKSRVDGRSYASVSNVNSDSMHGGVNRVGNANMVVSQHTTSNTHTLQPLQS